MFTDYALLDAALNGLYEKGAGFVPQYVDEPFAAALVANGAALGFERASEELNGVSQQFQRLVVDSIPDLEPVGWLAGDLTDDLTHNTWGNRDGRVPSLQNWQPNEACFQVYDGGEGIGWHRDFERCRLVIAVISLVGTARFQIERDSLGWVHDADWRLEPGDMVLMRAAGFGRSSSYRRPRHCLTECSPGRTSLTLRMMA